MTFCVHRNAVDDRRSAVDAMLYHRFTPGVASRLLAPLVTVAATRKAWRRQGRRTSAFHGPASIEYNPPPVSP